MSWIKITSRKQPWFDKVCNPQLKFKPQKNKNQIRLNDEVFNQYIVLFKLKTIFLELKNIYYNIHFSNILLGNRMANCFFSFELLFHFTSFSQSQGNKIEFYFTYLVNCATKPIAKPFSICLTITHFVRSYSLSIANMKMVSRQAIGKVGTQLTSWKNLIYENIMQPLAVNLDRSAKSLTLIYAITTLQ